MLNSFWVTFYAKLVLHQSSSCVSKGKVLNFLMVFLVSSKLSNLAVKRRYLTQKYYYTCTY